MEDSNSGSVKDNQTNFELQDYVTAAEDNHVLNFGVRARLYRDANFSNEEPTGRTPFESNASYLGKSRRLHGSQSSTTRQYVLRSWTPPSSTRTIGRSTRASLLSYGLRWETQNRIHDKSDWAPRVSLAYALGSANAKKPQKPCCVRDTDGSINASRFRTASLNIGRRIVHSHSQKAESSGLYVTDRPVSGKQSGSLPSTTRSNLQRKATDAIRRWNDFYAATTWGRAGWYWNRQIVRVVTANLTTSTLEDASSTHEQRWGSPFPTVARGHLSEPTVTRTRREL